MSQDDDYTGEIPSATSKPVINVATSTNSGINWSRGELIGKGQFGTVYRGLNLDSGEAIALKHIHFAQETLKAKEQVVAIQNEIAILKTLKTHRSIVSYLGTDRHSLDLYILMEYIPGGSIASQVKVHGPLKETLAQKWTREIVEGLEHLHSNEIVHRDIKGANILVNSTGNIKLADFGCAKQKFGPMSNGFTSVRGTPFWMAPEVIQGREYGTEADIWSLGATVLEMLNGRPPWYELGQMGALNALAKQIAVPAIPEHISAACRDFILKCLEYNPANRWNCKQLLAHPWLSGADFRKDEAKEGGAPSAEAGRPKPAVAPNTEPLPMRTPPEMPPFLALSPHPPGPRLSASPARGQSPLPNQLRFPLRPHKEKPSSLNELRPRRFTDGRRSSVQSGGAPFPFLETHSAILPRLGGDVSSCTSEDSKAKMSEMNDLSNDEGSDSEDSVRKGSDCASHPVIYSRKTQCLRAICSEEELSPMSPFPSPECRSSVSVSPVSASAQECGTPKSLRRSLPNMSPLLAPTTPRPFPCPPDGSPKLPSVRLPPTCRLGASPLPHNPSPRHQSLRFHSNAVRS
eukprot:EG_transcript_2767